MLPTISGHFETGDPLPEAILQRLLDSRTFQAAMQMVRQVEFALFDFRIHSAPSAPSADDITATVAVVRYPDFNRFPLAFSHIFAGGYAAGYYSYKWAEVLSADAFSAFEEAGVFDHETGRRFLSTILEVGGSVPPEDAFASFRGRGPSPEPLLRQSGILDGDGAP